MDQDDELTQEEKLLSKSLLGPARTPSSFETEAFVSRVMSRIQEEEGRRSRSWRWLVPALGFGLAMSLTLMLRLDIGSWTLEDMLLSERSQPQLEGLEEMFPNLTEEP